MARLLAHARFIIGALALVLIMAIAVPASAQQRNADGSVNPTASAVKEDQLLLELQRVQGRVSIPDQKSGTLIQPFTTFGGLFDRYDGWGGNAAKAHESAWVIRLWIRPATASEVRIRYSRPPRPAAAKAAFC